LDRRVLRQRWWSATQLDPRPGPHDRPALRADAALGTLDAMISAALQTGHPHVVTNERLSARARGVGYDQAGVDLFNTFVDCLRDRASGGIVEIPGDAVRRAMLPFYEACFSNFIEGTEFTIEEGTPRRRSRHHWHILDRCQPGAPSAGREECR
jgi:hypothetical protein